MKHDKNIQKKIMVIRYQILGLISLVLLGFCHCQQEQHSNFHPSKGETVRALKDTIGFSFTEEQITAVVQLSENLEQAELQANRQKYGAGSWIAGICPHDDHLLAGRVYVHLFQNLRAKRIVIFGVGHKAGQWGAKDVLIFDRFNFWRGPRGPVKVSDLREEIISLLPQSDFVINDDWQAEEHSVEGIVPFIQYYLPEAEIVSIIVPYMNWDRIGILSSHLAEALAKLVQKHDWQLGADIAFICSNDGDHYGDVAWGDKNFAPFGADEVGYLKATAQDSSLIKENLAGKLTGDKLKNFCSRVWGDSDLKDYKIRWCGRFSIPFGLNTVRLLAEKMNRPPLTGYFLRYANSYSLGKLPLENLGIGTTAPYHLRHWVGYSALGYR